MIRMKVLQQQDNVQATQNTEGTKLKRLKNINILDKLNIDKSVNFINRRKSHSKHKRRKIFKSHE